MSSSLLSAIENFNPNNIDSLSILISTLSPEEINKTGPKPFGRTALHLACKNSLPIMVIKMLIDNGADINCFTSPHQFTPFYLAVQSNNITNIQNFLTDLTCHVNEVDLGGMTPLIMACCNTNVLKSTIIFLLESERIDRFIKDSVTKRNALEWARDKGRKDIEEVFSNLNAE